MHETKMYRWNIWHKLDSEVKENKDVNFYKYLLPAVTRMLHWTMLFALVRWTKVNSWQISSRPLNTPLKLIVMKSPKSEYLRPLRGYSCEISNLYDKMYENGSVLSLMPALIPLFDVVVLGQFNRPKWNISVFKLSNKFLNPFSSFCVMLKQTNWQTTR